MVETASVVLDLIVCDQRIEGVIDGPERRHPVGGGGHGVNAVVDAASALQLLTA